MKALLDGLLPRLFPGMEFLCIAHEGKHDLRQSVPRKLKAWREPGVRFIVLHDNDGRDCKALKKEIADLCRQGNKPETLIRIVCQELEAWYFGEPEALAEAYQKEELKTLNYQARYRISDEIVKPSDELMSIIPEFQKKSGARLMGECLTRDRNRSHSFRVFLSGVRAEFNEIRGISSN
ncbi:MAG TPA: DUF4276 family protein [bacterium]|nr:DUF4276 family protein [bacterium]